MGKGLAVPRGLQARMRGRIPSQSTKREIVTSTGDLKRKNLQSPEGTPGPHLGKRRGKIEKRIGRKRMRTKRMKARKKIEKTEKEMRKGRKRLRRKWRMRRKKKRKLNVKRKKRKDREKD